MNYRVQSIESITNSNPMVLTTQAAHGYPAGINVSFLIPAQYGMFQLNILNGEILEVTDTTMTIGIDTTMMGAFSYPTPLPIAYTPASVIPNASSYPLPPPPLPFGNQKTFDGAIFNNGAINDPINGVVT